MADHNESFIDKAKDALGFGDEHDRHDQHGEQPELRHDQRFDDTGADTGTGYDVGRGPEAAMGRETTGTGTGAGTRGEAASGRSPLTDDDGVQTERRETGI